MYDEISSEFMTALLTVGKQTPCKLSFAYILVTSRINLTVRAKPKFGKFVVLFALVICEISYAAHMFGYIAIKSEPPHGKTNNLHRRKQRRISASR